MAEDEDLTLDLTGKKKKGRRTKILLLDDDSVADRQVAGEVDLNLTGKKPRKSRDIKLPEDTIDENEKDDGISVGIGMMNLLDAQIPQEWLDYTYDELLDMVFGIMREKNPEMAAGKKKAFVMKPPQVARAGSKKTAFANFAEICRILKRQPKHVLQFLMAELGTTGSIDGNQCLIVKGRFQQKHFESVLRKYIKEYVTCHTCRSSDTELTKDTRLFFLQCKTCGSRCSVIAIKSGFTAMVGKRAAARRAAEATAGK